MLSDCDERYPEQREGAKRVKRRNQWRRGEYISSEQDEFKSDAIECSLSFAPKSRCLLSQWVKNRLTTLINDCAAGQDA